MVSRSLDCLRCLTRPQAARSLPQAPSPDQAEPDQAETDLSEAPFRDIDELFRWLELQRIQVDELRAVTEDSFHAPAAAARINFGNHRGALNIRRPTALR